ncbi:hypothetical protein [Kitasatospora aureofaciens]|uniref:hypothetical protein n=1 Tax=Kitasatospora aureofaciens TaxID=1894 RepID=UPI002108B541|nr:hypothetical protein [Kitasatospora aureofaciens]
MTSRANRSCGSYVARAVPSAGAVYPYEFAVLVMENGVPTAFRIDADRRICARLAVGARVTAALDTSMLAIPEDGGTLVVTLTRPWLSMRKYGDRGYLYTQLDAGHAAGNLVLAAAGRGAPGALRLRFPRESLSGLLEAGENCREIHSAILVPAGSADESWTRWTVHDSTDRELRGPTWRSWLESTCWDSLAGWPEHSGSPALQAVPAPLARIRTDRQLPGGQGRLGDPSEWSELIGTRVSSKAFTGEPVSAAAVWRAVSALSTPLETDLPDASPLSATLVLRSTTEPEQDGVYRLHTGERRPGRLPSTDEVARACMQQRALAGAAAVLLLHVPRTSLAGAVAMLAYPLYPLGIVLGWPVWLLAVAQVAVGAGITFWGVMWATSVQTQVPGEVLNRVHAYEVAGSVGMFPVGSALAGPAVGAFGTDRVLQVGIVVALLTAAALLVARPTRTLGRVPNRA